MKEFLKSHDLFGHQVSLSFNNAGRTHKTLIGGIVSIFMVKFMMASYIYMLSYKLFSNGDDKNNSYTTRLDYLEMGELTFDKTNSLIAFQLMNPYFTSIPQSEIDKYFKLIAYVEIND